MRVVHPHSNKISTVSEFQCELFDQSLISTAEGIKIVAETDSFKFAVDGILAHGLLPDDDEAVLEFYSCDQLFELFVLGL